MNAMDSKISHDAKIQEFIKNKKGFLQASYTISDDGFPWIRVQRLIYDTPSGEIVVMIKEEIIDGIVYTSHDPETVKDLNLIENETKAY